MNTVLDLHIYKGRCNVPEQCLKTLLSGQDNGYVPDDRQVDAARKSRANSRVLVEGSARKEKTPVISAMAAKIKPVR